MGAGAENANVVSEKSNVGRAVNKQGSMSVQDRVEAERAEVRNQ
jgi:hypothetical protein